LGKIRNQKKVKLIVGLISARENLFLKVEELLSAKFGKVDFRSEIIPFEHTDYYENELGHGLRRQFLSFKHLIRPEDLVMLKIFANTIEAKLALKNLRQINVDPGYLNDAKVVLASTKDFTHRLYLEKGIFGEITLYYKNNTYNAWPWTFPDYKTREYIDIFNHIRKIYLEDLKNEAEI
jgi:hypothetical protein